MTRDVKTVTLDISLRELGALFEKDDFNIYPVAENVAGDRRGLEI